MVKPYRNNGEGKKEQVATMFNNIAPKYDLLNHVLSLGIDKLWRKKAVELLEPLQPKRILDIATGTGDFALENLRLNPEKIVGIDISAQMLAVGRKKIAKKNLGERIELLEGDSENIQFPDNTFDAITVAFGVRNFENLEKGLSEMCRVVRPNGKVMILELTNPQNAMIKKLYKFYFFRILPFWGRMVSKDAAAYTYLPESVAAFPDGEDFLRIYKRCGFKDVRQIKLSFGIASIYEGIV